MPRAVRGVEKVVAAPSRSFRAVLIGAALAGLATVPRHADAACLIAMTGTVNCDADTTTTDTTNRNGAESVSSDRTQRFNDGAAIHGTIQAGVAVNGFGLELSERAGTLQPISVNNQGQVTTANDGSALQFKGNGGSIDYAGDGSVTNTVQGGAGLLVDNRHGGDVSIATGAGAIRGATGIDATTTAHGALTIATGSGPVTGTAGPGILASTANGALKVKVGSGGVTSAAGNNPAIELTSNNGNISVTANGNISADGRGAVGFEQVHGIEAFSNGRGNIVVGGSGTIFGEDGRAIYARENAHALGGIVVTGTGDTISGATLNGVAVGCCSAIRAEIDNPADSSNIIVDRSGNVTTTSRTDVTVLSAIHAITAGTGNITVTDGDGAAITNPNLYGINAAEFGRASTGSINVTTGALSTINAGGAGIYAANSAFAIPGSAGATIAVTNEGTINSGANLNPVGPRFPLEGGAAPTTMPAGIFAGFTGGSVFGLVAGPYTSCGIYGCTTVAPNPHVHGSVAVVNNGAINAAGGDGIYGFDFGKGDVSVTSSAPITVSGSAAHNGIETFSAERGNTSVTTAANVSTVNGSGIQTLALAAGRTMIDAFAGTIQGGASGISATSAGNNIRINSWAIIRNISGGAGDLAVATSGASNAALTNHAAGIVTGTIAMTGTGTNNFANAGTWNTVGGNTFGDSNLNNSGTINLYGPAAFGGLQSLTTAGTLNLAVGSAIGTLMLPGTLAFRSGALYIAPLNQTALAKIDVGGMASLAGSVQGAMLIAPFSNETSILHSAGLGGSRFNSFTAPAGFTGDLIYTPTEVIAHLTSILGAGSGLNNEQQGIAAQINKFFNDGGTLPGGFANVFAASGGNLGIAINQIIDGGVAADAELPAFQLMNQFLNLMLDPFVDGRLGSGVGIVSGRAIGFAPDEEASLPPDIALAYAAILKAPPPPFAQRWTAWSTTYGGGNWTSGNAAVGSSNVSAQTYGFAAGMDYHYSPDTIFGFALGGGGTNWGLATGGTGTSEAFQTGVYGLTRSGPVYLHAALAFANHWFTTNRSALGDQLTANFAAQSYGARLEGGYRYDTLPTLGVTPYAALQAQDFRTPSYSEADLTGGGLGLSYAAMNATDIRSELGARLDNPEVVAGMPLLLRARVAWAHDWVSNPSLSAAFESLPGTNFTVNGAPLPHDAALTSAGAEFFITPRWTFLVKFDGEFAPGSQTYTGSGVLRYRW